MMGPLRLSQFGKILEEQEGFSEIQKPSLTGFSENQRLEASCFY
jgi:hypothetical protein